MADEHELHTHFAPARRSSVQELQVYIEKLGRNPVVDGLMNLASGMFAVLNDNRQVLAVNETFLRTLGMDDWEKELGLRLGEAVRCIHADEAPDGCGTTEFCPSCGAAVAMVASLETNKPVERACAVTVLKGGRKVDLYFNVRACPITMEGERFLLLFLQDNTKQQQWAALERVFFHDIGSTAAALLMASEIVSSRHETDATVQDVRQLAFRIARELSVQRRLLNEGMDAYKPAFDDVTVRQILADIEMLYADNVLARTRSLTFPECFPDLSLKTDSFLVGRVLGNMITNALEATAEGEEVRVSVELGGGKLTFAVWNKEAIAEEMVTRIFQRNYSTKAEAGRGLGTYSMKLFGEEMLGGIVDFTTSPQEGTTFRFSLSC